ncbi:uncharacterized protein LOC132699000 isoform X2 [Cylas formicarius]|uniref:uncharacterized protein LOC132699000 isoform X2 n=1 Tax=Cylas formicarius TaxID=197179 RepID=UPI0029586612|nr:uncharacterized protein LOC132699000 isoform X2 [Cylas formicarius]
MDKRIIERIKKYYETLVDERDIFLETSDKLLKNILQLVELPNFHPNGGKFLSGQVLEYEMKVLKLFSEINVSLLNFLHTEIIPTLCGTNYSRGQEDACQDLGDYLKVTVNSEFPIFVSSKEGAPKLNNCEVQNGSYAKKPLDNDLLKIICANLTTGTQTNLEKPETSGENDSLILSQFSESEPTSSSSMSYQHPITKFQYLTNQMPEGYEIPNDVLVVKEYLKELNSKHGLDDNVISEMKREFGKTIPSLNYEYEMPVRETAKCSAGGPSFSKVVPAGSADVGPVLQPTTTKYHSPPQSLGRCGKPPEPVPSTSTASLLNNQILAAHREDSKIDLIEFSNSDTDSDLLDRTSAVPSALVKLKSKKRHDRDEEARQKVLEESMPDIRFVPAEPPAVIKNNLNGSCVSRAKTKDRNLAAALCELKNLPVPALHTACVFCHVDSPTEFYIQPVTDDCLLDWVSYTLSAKLKGSHPEFVTKQEAFSKLGKYCVAYVLEQKEWYRMRVLDWKLGNNTREVEVQSVDYGFRLALSFTYLRSMTKEVADVPMQAIRCHLPFLYPPGSTFMNRLTEWPLSSVEGMLEIVNVYGQDTGNISFFRIDHAVLEGKSLAVDLSPYGKPGSDTVGQMLIDLEVAVQIIDDFLGHSELGEFLEDIDELENGDNLNELLIGYDARDEARICRFTRSDGSCYKGKHCKLEHVALPKDGYTTDTVPVHYRCANDLRLPKNGDHIQVLISEYVDSCTFLAQIIRNPVKDDSGIVMDKELRDLVAAMNHAKVTSTYEPLKVWPAIGEMVVAYHFTKTWMRGVVSDSKKNEIGDVISVKVYMMDFGDTLEVKLKELRKMKEEFTRLPAQIVKLYLYNFQHKAACDAKRARKFFEKNIAYRNFVAHIIFGASQLPVPKKEIQHFSSLFLLS